MTTTLLQLAPSGGDALPPLIPPFRFQLVQADIYRGAYPQPHNYRFLKRLQLRTMVSLVTELRPELCAFCAEESIRLVQLHVDRPKEHVPLTPQHVHQALHYLVDPAQYAPLYLHCLDGANVTGMAIACLRKLQLWTVPAATLEFARFTRDSVVLPEESEFLDRFGTPLAVSTVHVLPSSGGGAEEGRQFRIVDPSQTQPRQSSVANLSLSTTAPTTTATPSTPTVTPIVELNLVEIPVQIPEWLWPGGQIPSSFLRSVTPATSTQPLTITYAHPTVRIRLHYNHLMAIVTHILSMSPFTRTLRASPNPMMAPPPVMLTSTAAAAAAVGAGIQGTPSGSPLTRPLALYPSSHLTNHNAHTNNTQNNVAGLHPTEESSSEHHHGVPVTAANLSANHDEVSLTVQALALEGLQ